MVFMSLMLFEESGSIISKRCRICLDLSQLSGKNLKELLIDYVWARNTIDQKLLKIKSDAAY